MSGRAARGVWLRRARVWRLRSRLRVAQVEEQRAEARSVPAAAAERRVQLRLQRLPYEEGGERLPSAERTQGAAHLSELRRLRAAVRVGRRGERHAQLLAHRLARCVGGGDEGGAARRAAAAASRGAAGAGIVRAARREAEAIHDGNHGQTEGRKVHEAIKHVAQPVCV